MLEVTMLLLIFLVGLPIVVLVLARRGRTLRIVSALIAIGVGAALGALAFTPASSLPDLPLLGVAVELLVMTLFPFSLVLLVGYPLGLISLGLFLLLQRSKNKPHAAGSKQR